MIADTVASSTPNGVIPSQRNLPTKESQMEMDDFLKLLTSQLQYQDPMEPMKDTEFIAQMASFSSLDQMSSLNKNFESFFQTQMNQSVQSYLGKVVTLQGGESAETHGLVTAVTHKDGVMKLTVNGSDHDASHVTRVELPQEQE
jgi:flagellar basal-body rod modification protein FlgD